MNRQIKNFFKRSFRKLFTTGQKAGITILPYHYYSQIPNIRELKKEEYWRKPFSMAGVGGMNIVEQVEFLEETTTKNDKGPLREMYQNAVKTNGEDGGYGLIEGEFLYCFIRRNRPAKIVQVGCGVSTAIILNAARDEGYKPEIVCVEPFPTGYLTELDRKGEITLVREKAQKAEIRQLTDLKSNDLFFVDSTHTVKPGSEVNRIILEVLPQMGAGVWVHFHDIYFPYDYGRALLTEDLFFWSESTLLHAFLINNARYGVKMSFSYVHYNAPEKLMRALPDYIPQKSTFGLRDGEEGHFPSAIYLQTK
ncbi:MAG TPA: class I SAM-dependent methyltransferase [Puia sp.]|jgi:hypothetical protein